MQSLKRSWERAELLLETARQRPHKIKSLSSTSSTPSKWKSIHQKLAELYIEECGREPKQKSLRNASHLLDKLVARDKLSCLVVNLYPGNEGYSVMLKGRNGMDTETVRLPYEESELLQYVDNEELPPVLVDILECSQVNIFYSGCVIAEVRDYRRSSCPLVYESHYVLLRPSTQTLIRDVNSLTSDGNKWTPEDRMMLESNLLLATQEPLCLEPSITVALVANYLHHSKHKFGVYPIKNMVKQFSQPVINRSWKFKQHLAPPSLQLYDFLVNHRSKKYDEFTMTSKSHSEAGSKSLEILLTPPEEIEVLKYATTLQTSPNIAENSLDFVEEYTLESKQSNGKGYYCRLTIYLRSLDDEFFGELYTDRDYVDGQMKGAMCRFQLGSRANVEKYLHQYIDIFTQESRKAVKITHQVKGQDITVTSIPSGQSIFLPLTNESDSLLSLPSSFLSPAAVLAPLSASSLPSSSTIANDHDDTSSEKKSGSSKCLQPPSTASSDNSSSKSSTIDSGITINTTMTNSAIQNSLSSQVISSARTGSWQSNSSQRPLSRQSSISPGPNVTSPGQPNAQLAAISAQSKSNSTPPQSTRTPTPTPILQHVGQSSTKTISTPPPSNPVSIPSPPAILSSLRRPQSADVVPSIGLLNRIQPNLTGFISGATNESGPTLTPVSLTGMTVPPGIAVPISLTMMASNQPSIITTPAGVLVSPLPSLVASGSPTRTAGLGSHSSQLAGSPALTSTSSISSSALMVTSAVHSASSVLAAPAGMVSFPVGLTGSLSSQNLAARFIASNLKGQSVTLQPSGPNSLGLLQVTGSHPPAPLFSTGTVHRPNLSSKGTGAASTTPPASGTTPPPSNISGGSSLMAMSSQQLQLTLQQKTQQIVSQQIQNVRQQSSTSSHPTTPKPKIRKRGGTTPPK